MCNCFRIFVEMSLTQHIMHAYTRMTSRQASKTINSTYYTNWMLAMNENKKTICVYTIEKWVSECMNEWTNEWIVSCGITDWIVMVSFFISVMLTNCRRWWHSSGFLFLFMLHIIVVCVYLFRSVWWQHVQCAHCIAIYVI